ncbi:MAG: type II toxin-antitoxin system RelE/ParE family toxin [Bacteroidetes bacterium]|nr:type II toxin-antitoxin system RelE/ParE family toxin [Bacteroidota bacterium]
MVRRKDVVISRMAMNSIREIYDYVNDREKSVAKAQYVKNAILEKCLSLKDFSGYAIDPFLADYTEEYRSVCIWEYVIIYLVDEKRVKVLNVVHSKQHPEIRQNI